MGIFRGCLIALELSTSLKFAKKKDLKKKVTDNDGIISYIINKKCTYLVLSDAEKVDSYKSRTAQKLGIPVVSIDFIHASVEKEKLLDSDDFLIAGKTKNDEFSTGKIVAAKQTDNVKGKIKQVTVNLHSFKVWPWGDKNAPTFNEKDYQVAKCILLKKEDVKKPTQFYAIEIHVNNDLESNEDSFAFRVFCHHGVVKYQMDEKSGTRECRYTKSADEALAIFSELYRQQTNAPNNYVQTKENLSRNIGSEKFQQIHVENSFDNVDLEHSVTELVEHVWQEATGQLSDILAVPVETIEIEKIEKAEAVLVEIRRAIDESKPLGIILKLSNDFYNHLPHNNAFRTDNWDKKILARKQDLCQLIRDMISVSEATDWSVRSSTEAKYRALRCHISDVTDAKERQTIENMLHETHSGHSDMFIHNIYAVQRTVEDGAMRKDLSDVKLLFHASSVQNFVGILSRGLLLPKVVVDDFGGKRTDAGMLGNGIYFADDSSTSLKYSTASQTKGTRLMLINDVALGECKDFYKRNLKLKSPPEGYNSCHGVRKTEGTQSEFEDDEFVIYNTNQQRIRYVIEFTRQEDEKKTLSYPAMEDFDMAVEDSNDQDTIDLKDIQDIIDPMSKIEAGLRSSNDSAIPLRSVHVRAQLLDLSSQVVVLQEYYNESNTSIEAKYIFPLGDMAAVVGFEAFINGKHIVGEVKEKETAHREYKEAIREGHGAYLMDQDKETPDVFTVSVGNLPPYATVLIKITYVAELLVEGENICFDVPGSVAPWKKDSALAEVTQDDVVTIRIDKDDQKEVTVQIAVQMPFPIKELTCPTHKVKLKKTECSAVVEMDKNQSLADGFKLMIGLAEIHVPRMWVERHPVKEDSQACMLTFYPEFEACTTDNFEVVFLLDLSNSMKGTNIIEAKKILMLSLHHLPNNCLFNVVVFGTGFDELFPSSKVKNKESLRQAARFIQKVQARMGNTEVFRPLHSFFLLSPKDRTRNIFFLSDGHINSEEVTMKAVSKNSKCTRLFTFGLSSTANKHTLRRLAQVGSGAYEFFDSKVKSKWEGKIQNQLSKASQPALKSVSVEWQQFNEDDPRPLQAPTQITSLFSGSRQVVYGFVPHCQQATLKAVIDNREVSTMVSTSELSITTGKTLHQLTAKAVIRDWEDGLLDAERAEHEIHKKNRKNEVIKLSTEFSIVTQFTSFVAIEKRDKDEDMSKKTGPSIKELVEKDSVDILKTMGWEKSQGPMIEDPEKKVEGLLKSGDCQQFTFTEKAMSAYVEAWEIAKNKLPSNHPLRLKVAINYSTFLKDTIGDEDKALAIGKQAFDDATAALNILSEDSYKDSTLLMQSLKDNMTLWSKDEFEFTGSYSCLSEEGEEFYEEEIYDENIVWGFSSDEDMEFDIAEVSRGPKEKLRRKAPATGSVLLDEGSVSQSSGRRELPGKRPRLGKALTLDANLRKQGEKMDTTESSSAFPRKKKGRSRAKFSELCGLEASIDTLLPSLMHLNATMEEDMGFGLFDDEKARGPGPKKGRIPDKVATVSHSGRTLVGSAMARSIVDDNTAELKDTRTNESMPLAAPMLSGLGTNELSLEEAIAKQNTLIEAIQRGVIDGTKTTVTDPASGEKVSLGFAVARGIVDGNTGELKDTRTNESMPLAAPMLRGLVTDDDKPQMSLEDAARYGLVDCKSGIVKDPRTGHEVTMAEAMDKGIIDKRKSTIKPPQTGSGYVQNFYSPRLEPRVAKKAHDLGREDNGSKDTQGMIETLMATDFCRKPSRKSRGIVEKEYSLAAANPPPSPTTGAPPPPPPPYIRYAMSSPMHYSARRSRPMHYSASPRQEQEELRSPAAKLMTGKALSEAASIMKAAPRRMNYEHTPHRSAQVPNEVVYGAFEEYYNDCAEIEIEKRLPPPPIPKLPPVQKESRFKRPSLPSGMNLNPPAGKSLRKRKEDGLDKGLNLSDSPSKITAHRNMSDESEDIYDDCAEIEIKKRLPIAEPEEEYSIPEANAPIDEDEEEYIIPEEEYSIREAISPPPPPPPTHPKKLYSAQIKSRNCRPAVQGLGRRISSQGMTNSANFIPELLRKRTQDEPGLSAVYLRTGTALNEAAPIMADAMSDEAEKKREMAIKLNSRRIGIGGSSMLTRSMGRFMPRGMSHRSQEGMVMRRRMHKSSMDSDEQHVISLDISNAISKPMDPFEFGAKGFADVVLVDDRLRIEKISTQEPTLDHDKLTELVGLQNQEGYWDFSPRMNEILGIDGDKCETMLYDAGLKSLGSSVAQKILKLFATAIVLGRLFQQNRKGLKMLEEITTVFKAPEKHFPDVFEYLLVSDYVLICLGPAIRKALVFCGKVMNDSPMLISSLELGKDFKEVLFKLLGITEPPSDQRARSKETRV